MSRHVMGHNSLTLQGNNLNLMTVQRTENSEFCFPLTLGKQNSLFPVYGVRH